MLSIGLIGALWSASGYLGAFTRAGNVVYAVEESRPSGSCARSRSA